MLPAVCLSCYPVDGCWQVAVSPLKRYVFAGYYFILLLSMPLTSIVQSAISDTVLNEETLWQETTKMMNPLTWQHSGRLFDNTAAAGNQSSYGWPVQRRLAILHVGNTAFLHSVWPLLWTRLSLWYQDDDHQGKSVELASATAMAINTTWYK